jgi:predicted dehydrogenase
MEKDSRRSFLKKAVAGTVGMTVGANLITSAKSYSKIIGSNKIIKIAIIGTNGRGSSMAGTFAGQPDTEVKYICDVEEKALKKGIDAVKKVTGKEPAPVKDFRKILDDKEVDAVYIAMPDHWHAPATILACKAGKHVYVEKPLSHNPREGELVVEAALKHTRAVQIGTQRRSATTLAQGMKELREGVIGKVYMAKGWYVNTRPSIGIGKIVPVPSNLDYELWQGPAPRRPYKDNLIHYNWHWFWNWGTGEALNNGTHEIDVIRWGLGIDYPSSVSSYGGRYHFKDDWETPDTQIITYNCPGVTVVWEGRSCNGNLIDDRSRGVIFYGENGAMSCGDNSYKIFDNKSKLVKDVKPDKAPGDSQNNADDLDSVHAANFLTSVRYLQRPVADALMGHKSTLWVQLGNIAQRVGHSLEIDSLTGHIKGDHAAEKLWDREYEKGWKPEL